MELHATYCLTEISEANLSRAMNPMVIYTTYINNKRKRSGYLFQAGLDNDIFY